MNALRATISRPNTMKYMGRRLLATATHHHSLPKPPLPVR